MNSIANLFYIMKLTFQKVSLNRILQQIYAKKHMQKIGLLSLEHMKILRKILLILLILKKKKI